MTTFTFDDRSLVVTTPPQSAPAGAALLTINGWTCGLGPRSVRKLADAMLARQADPARRLHSARFALDPDWNLVLDVGWSNGPVAGVDLVVVEHGTPTDTRITIPDDEIGSVADALAHLHAAA